jgi:hypothetical protein
LAQDGRLEQCPVFIIIPKVAAEQRRQQIKKKTFGILKKCVSVFEPILDESKTLAT